MLHNDRYASTTSETQYTSISDHDDFISQRNSLIGQSVERGGVPPIFIHNVYKSPVPTKHRYWYSSSSPRADHFSVSSSFPRGIICIQNPHLLAALVSSTKSITSLLAHSLHLSYLPHRLLELLHPGPVVLHIVLLNLLHMVVSLWKIHAFGVLPRKVPHQT